MNVELPQEIIKFYIRLRIFFRIKHFNIEKIYPKKKSDIRKKIKKLKKIVS